MSGESRPDSLTSSPRAKSYATAAVLASDVDLTAEFGGPVRQIRVGVAGDLVLGFADGSTETFYSVQVGEPLLYQATKLIASGSTAQKITVGP